MDKAARYLGIMRKANALAIGETDSGAAVKGGRAFVLCLALDASDNARKRAETFVWSRETPLICLPYEKAALQQALGKGGGCSMFGITDLGLASAFVGALANWDPEQYGPVHEALSSRVSSVKGRSDSVKTGKRRK